MRRVFAWFSHFCMSLPYLCPILAKTIRLSKDNSKIINSSFFPACLRLWATARIENISYFLQIKSYLRFRVCFVRHLECFYTGAKNFYTISRIRLCNHSLQIFFIGVKIFYNHLYDLKPLPTLIFLVCNKLLSISTGLVSAVENTKMFHFV